MTESPLEYSFENLFVGQKANFLKKIDETLVNDFAKISGDFNIKKFGLIVLSTDEMGYGVDFGDYVLGFRYQDENVNCEFPGGVGNLEAPSFA